jgi:hypothetical protein
MGLRFREPRLRPSDEISDRALRSGQGAGELQASNLTWGDRVFRGRQAQSRGGFDALDVTSASFGASYGESMGVEGTRWAAKSVGC